LNSLNYFLKEKFVFLENSLTKKLFSKSKLIFHFIWVFPVLLIIRLIYPLYKIRFALIDSERIGHFNNHCTFFWVEYQKKAKNTLHLFWCSKNFANEYWYKLSKRNLPIFDFVYYLFYWNNKIPGGQKHKLIRPIWLEQGKYKKDFVPLKISAEENEIAYQWLGNLGIGKQDKIACIIIRDSNYLENTPLHSQNDWSYHSYRDTNINSYIDAMEWLTSKGYWVFRMGKSMKEKIKSKNPKIIDFAFLEDKNDFIDIWLFANCDMCISTGTGLDAVSDIYDKPILFLNYIPLFNIWSWSRSLTVPKRLYWKKSQQELNLKDYFINNFFRTEDYEKNGIEIRDLSSEEILIYTQEFYNRINNFWIDSDENKIAQQKFWKLIATIPSKFKMHTWINPENWVGSYWLNSIEIPD
jgi:putative glycosyltransferase (TIGR04372 family)